jgi:hypothetical protein
MSGDSVEVREAGAGSAGNKKSMDTVSNGLMLTS